MARYRDPKAKVARRCSSPIFSSSIHKVLRRKHYPPGQHGKKRSQFGLQLVEQQKAKYIYGLLQRQFKNLCVKAAKSKSITGEEYFSS